MPLLAWIVPLCAGASAAQFASRVDVVEVYVTVTDDRGRSVPGLGPDDFEVADDGVPQRIAAFAAGEFPLAVALGLDRSFSVGRERLADAVAALRGFVEALRPADQVTLVAIGSQPEILAPLTSDHASIRMALTRVEPWGTTPLHDATIQALNVMQPVRGRRALILLSDGVDRYSRAAEADVLDAARRGDVLVYPIALGRARPPIFGELAAVSGGRSFQAADRRALDAILSTIAEELRFQYLLGYAPAGGASSLPGWHAIDVTVKRPGVRVRARDGYFAP